MNISLNSIYEIILHRIDDYLPETSSIEVYHSIKCDAISCREMARKGSQPEMGDYVTYLIYLLHYKARVFEGKTKEELYELKAVAAKKTAIGAISRNLLGRIELVRSTVVAYAEREVCLSKAGAYFNSIPCEKLDLLYPLPVTGVDGDVSNDYFYREKNGNGGVWLNSINNLGRFAIYNFISDLRSNPQNAKNASAECSRLLRYSHNTYGTDNLLGNLYIQSARLTQKTILTLRKSNAVYEREVMVDKLEEFIAKLEKSRKKGIRAMKIDNIAVHAQAAVAALQPDLKKHEVCFNKFLKQAKQVLIDTNNQASHLRHDEVYWRASERTEEGLAKYKKEIINYKQETIVHISQVVNLGTGYIDHSL